MEIATSNIRRLSNEQMNRLRNVNAVMDMLNRSANIMAKLPQCMERDMAVANIKDAMRRAEATKSLYTSVNFEAYA